MSLRQPYRGLSRSPAGSRRVEESTLDFKAAAREVLEEIGHPIHYTDITEIALESGYLKSSGKTPHNTMRARLSVDVRDNPDSRFTQTAPGVYGLKGFGGGGM